MNVSRGLSRLWAVVSLLWIAAWTPQTISIWRDAATVLPARPEAKTDLTQNQIDNLFEGPISKRQTRRSANATQNPFEEFGFANEPEKREVAESLKRAAFDADAWDKLAAEVRFARDARSSSLVVMCAPPALLLVLGAAGAWVVRGFKGS